MREKGQTEVAKTLETPVFSRGIEILTEKFQFLLQRCEAVLRLPMAAKVPLELLSKLPVREAMAAVLFPPGGGPAILGE